MATSDKLLAEWFWIDRWMGSSAFSLPIAARGLYREMLTQAWRRGAQLPKSHEQIRRLVGVTVPEWRRTWPKVKKYWRVRGSCLINETQIQIYLSAKLRSENATRKAQKAAQARHKQSQSTAQAVPEYVPLSLSPSLYKNKKKDAGQSIAADVSLRATPQRRKGIPGGTNCPHQQTCRTTKTCIERTLREGQASA